MPCTSPLRAWMKHPIYGEGLAFDIRESQIYVDTKHRTKSHALTALTPNPYMHIKCGKCISCRIAQSRMWGIRMQHEAKMHRFNSFLTLTINDAHLLSRHNPYTLDLKEQQDFLKRLRHHLYPQKIRFFFCGEYGDKNKRPHYHAIIFGYDFPDRKHFKTINGYSLYTSAMLQDLWPQGFSSIGAVSYDSAAYVARYCTKKLTGDLAKEKYNVYDSDTGEWWPLRPDYSTMSRRPGIGATWIKKYWKDVYPRDELVVKTEKGIFKTKPPKFYDNYYEAKDPKGFETLKQLRTEYAGENQLDEERIETLHNLSIHRQKRIMRDMFDDENIYK